MSTPEQPGSAGNGRPAQTQSPAQPPAPRPPTAAWPPVEQDGSRPNHQDVPRQGPQDGPRPAPQDAPRQGPRPARTDGAPQQRQPEPARQPEPQRQPQTNLPPRGSDQTRPEQTRQEPNRTTVQPAARAVDGQKATERPRQSRPAEATAKAAVIDGPTRNIARNDLPTDMPDLSTVRHPMHEEQRSERQAPVAVAQPVGSGDPLRATVQIRKIDPWSMLKLSLVISVSLFFVWMVAVGLLYMVLDGMGVWDRLNNAFSDIVATSGESGLVSAGQIFGYAAVIGLINVVLFTALTTIGTFIYNLCSDLVGGLEVTLADRD
ncbi:MULTISPECIES: DUF3566 domain-containing protein [unclassified Rhodococcus (in: high G+C Gram-positive bacteria)]|uniref:DUF3566 domain-containing protein n=1 Tax=unclassified Rhodococcus (in: high G+C Gram-positive bacteria) TaxID=192944 RepID=UPI0012E3FA48|nr:MULTISPECIES: DUF3566 domain-containing protein [unclassified Rhodococcus (in: high G+C Gram-positive bacteria)]